MKLGVVTDGGWAFVSELLADWQGRYETQVFSHREVSLPISEGRVNRWRLKWALKRFVNSNDVVFFEWAGPLLVVASRLAARASIVVRLHSYELYDFAPRICWRAVHRVILVSNAMRRRFCDLCPSAADKTTVVYYGKSMTKYHPRERDFSGVIGMLCHLVPIKRVYEVILALYELNQTRMSLRLRIAGPPRPGADNQRYYAAMERLVSELRLEDCVSFEGYVDNPAGFLSDIDIFLSNSYWEGQQNALLEAMATGCYCLSHFWDGAEEVLPPDNLYVTDKELCEKIISYCQLPESEKQTQRALMRKIAEEKFDIRNTSAAVRDIVEEAGASASR